MNPKIMAKSEFDEFDEYFDEEDEEDYNKYESDNIDFANLIDEKTE